ncbi:ATPase, T2SS/T4P/T4SS family [Streptomyces sp. NPDC053720]|uniref:ATPase, T2SS/T4P/T4SS family n=1 Tax=Streptomyces sp. NPDC053720 TaxID=3154855 RepID=UPI003434FE29
MNSHTSLEQLEQNGFLNQALSRFLNACVLGELNLVISGPGKSGRTTLLRALGQAAPAYQRIVTLEPLPQLGLAGPGRQVVEMSGPHTTALVPLALHHDAHRILVDQPETDALPAVLQAMSSGRGSMCTVTAADPRDAIDQLTDLCTAALGPAAPRQVEEAVDLVIHLSHHPGQPGGHRFISHISETTRHHQNPAVALHMVFAPVPGQPRAVFQNEPACLGRLEQNGFDRADLTEAALTWGPA